MPILACIVTGDAFVVTIITDFHLSKIAVFCGDFGGVDDVSVPSVAFVFGMAIFVVATTANTNLMTDCVMDDVLNYAYVFTFY